MKKNSISSTEEFTRRYPENILYLIWGRIVFLIIFTGSIVAFNHDAIQFLPSSPEILLLLSACGIYIALGIFYLIYYYFFSSVFHVKYLTFALSQILLDIPFWTVLVLITGGPDSFFVFLFHISIMLGGIYCSFRGIVFTLTLGIFFYLLLAILEPIGIIPSYLKPFVVIVHHDPAGLYYRIITVILSMILVALLVWYLVVRASKLESELNKAVTIFRDLNRLNEAIVSIVPSCLITVDMSGRIKTMNRYAREIFRLEERDFEGKNISEVIDISPEELQIPSCSKKITLSCADGERIFECTISPLTDTQEQRVGSIVHLADVTDTVRVQREMSELERGATLASIAAGLAHEIRNPLSCITGSVQTVLRFGSLKEEEKKLLEIILKEIKKIDNLVSNLMNLSKGSEKIEFSNFELATLVDEIVSLIRASGMFPGIKILNEVSHGIFVEADRTKIGQVLMNLIKNALESTEEAGGEKVKLSAIVIGNGKVEVDIEDEGKGITEEESSKIFNQFFSTKKWGTGLGLSISRAIMINHGEEIGFKPNLKSGSIFYFTLKIAS